MVGFFQLKSGGISSFALVDTAYLNFGKEDQRPIPRATLPEIKQYLKDGHFNPGSMKQKIEAIIEFIEGGGQKSHHHFSIKPSESR